MNKLLECTRGPWRTTPDEKWTADIRITSEACRHIAKVYGPEPGVQSPNAVLLAAAYDHALIGWAVFHNFIDIACSAATGDAAIRSDDLDIDLTWAKLDPFGFPVLTDDLRQRLILEMETLS